MHCYIGNVAVHVHAYIVPTMLADILYLLQGSDAPLHYAAKGGHTTVVEHLISTPGIDVNVKDKVSWYIDLFLSIVGLFNDQVIMICMVLNTILYMDGDVRP